MKLREFFCTCFSKCSADFVSPVRKGNIKGVFMSSIKLATHQYVVIALNIEDSYIDNLNPSSLGQKDGNTPLRGGVMTLFDGFGRLIIRLKTLIYS